RGLASHATNAVDPRRFAAEKENKPDVPPAPAFDATPQDLGPLDMESLKNSSRTAPMPTDMSAMRELANNTARTAIAKSHRRSHLEAAAGKLIVCGVMVGASTYMMGAADSVLNPLFLLGGGIAASGSYVGYQLAQVLLAAYRDSRLSKDSAEETESTPQEDADAPEHQPTDVAETTN
ncbi:MAG: hypothetical protein AAF961_04030, partial [Planctomycetota bacterium]